ncbi:MAG TPA: DUF1015 domain-containing protein [Chloroflexota bacterium]|nr:DUF1015 domain-containing protein [Chloroflexota bacterium]
MADVRPFRGLRFDPQRVDLGAVVCPPYDVISPAEQQAYHDRHPLNVIRLELGLGAPDPRLPGNRYVRAAETLARWRAEGILIEEARPAFYLYEHRFMLGSQARRRRGLLVAGRLHDEAERAVLPHEDTRAGPIEDRLALLRATATNLSPLWLLYEDADRRVGEALAAGWESPPVATAEVDGESHRLHVVDDPVLVREVVDAIATRPLYIADGHHRYRTAQVYRDERRRLDGAQAGGPEGGAGEAGEAGQRPEAGYEFALMLLVALDDPGLVVLPTHRLVRHPQRTPSEVRQALATWLTLTPLPSPGGDHLAAGQALEAALRDAGETGHPIVLYEREGAWLLRTRDDVDWRGQLPPGHSSSWQELDVAVLDALVIRGACGIRAEGEAAHAAGAADRLAYVSEAAAAVAAVRSGQADQAYLLRPTRVQQVCDVAAAGDRMPPKSTYFFPKPVTGLVLRTLDPQPPGMWGR